MQTPIQISFHQMEPSPAIEARIREKVAKLEHFYAGLIRCRVVVERAFHYHEHERGPVSVRFELVLPASKTIVGGGSGTCNDAADDFEGALKAAFDATKRQLHDHVATLRGDQAPARRGGGAA